jgi:hypothetical protein
VLHANDQTRLEHALRVVQSAVELSPQPVALPPLILERLVAPFAGSPA